MPFHPAVAPHVEHPPWRCPLRAGLDVAVIAASLAFLALIAVDPMTSGALEAPHRRIAEWMNGHRGVETTRWMYLVAKAHSVVPLFLGAWFLALWLIWRGDWRWLASLFAMMVVLLVGVLLGVPAVQSVPGEAVFGHATPRFPSGPVWGATLFHGFLALVAFARSTRLVIRLSVVGAAVALVFAAAASGLYFGGILAETLAAMALALAWLVCCVCWLQGPGYDRLQRWLRRRQQQ